MTKNDSRLEDPNDAEDGPLTKAIRAASYEANQRGVDPQEPMDSAIHRSLVAQDRPGF